MSQIISVLIICVCKKLIRCSHNQTNKECQSMNSKKIRISEREHKKEQEANIYRAIATDFDHSVPN